MLAEINKENNIMGKEAKKALQDYTAKRAELAAKWIQVALQRPSNKKHSVEVTTGNLKHRLQDFCGLCYYSKPDFNQIINMYFSPSERDGDTWYYEFDDRSPGLNIDFNHAIPELYDLVADAREAYDKFDDLRKGEAND
jgi:hypothetical protein